MFACLMIDNAIRIWSGFVTTKTFGLVMLTAALGTNQRRSSLSNVTGVFGRTSIVTLDEIT